MCQLVFIIHMNTLPWACVSKEQWNPVWEIFGQILLEPIVKCKKGYR